MTFKIGGFGSVLREPKALSSTSTPGAATAPRRSLVRVRFPGRDTALTYYNDRFDLKQGDLVYVDGKLEGQLGRVEEVSYNFKIKRSDYKQVTALVDTQVHGRLFFAGSHFIAFEPGVIPAKQIVSWFKAPEDETEAFVTGSDDTSFPLEDLCGMPISAAVAQRGQEYYAEGRVRYFCIENEKGIAIVEGSENYIVEFCYRDGQISHLVCDCPCGYTCKHAFAAMLQLRQTLDIVDEHYREEYRRTGYIAAISKGTLFAFAIVRKETGSFSL